MNKQHKKGAYVFPYVCVSNHHTLHMQKLKLFCDCVGKMKIPSTISTISSKYKNGVAAKVTNKGAKRILFKMSGLE